VLTRILGNQKEKRKSLDRTDNNEIMVMKSKAMRSVVEGKQTTAY
jgi:hypothetical protein